MKLMKKHCRNILVSCIVLLTAMLAIGAGSTDSAGNADAGLPQEAELCFEKGKACEEAKEYAAAIEWYQKAAEAGSTAAMKKIGHMYYDGIGVTIDAEKAWEWYRKAADAGDAGAMAAVYSFAASHSFPFSKQSAAS